MSGFRQPTIYVDIETKKSLDLNTYKQGHKGAFNASPTVHFMNINIHKGLKTLKKHT